MALLLGGSLPAPALGQERRFFFSTPPAGSLAERQARSADLLDSTSRAQWTIRPLTPKGPVSRAGLTEASITLIENSSFAYGFNDGPVWAGKGITTAVTAGAELIRPHLSITIAPMAFVTQNAPFAIGNNGLAGDRRFADLMRPDAIDLPQRFGSKSYAAFNPGESEVAVSGFGLRGGASSRSQIWGPAWEHPMVLGNNAGGIPRLFAGTSSPVDLRWITFDAQIIWGQVNESAFGKDTGSMRRHFVNAAIATIGVKRFPLEIGMTRFFHTYWPENGALHVSWLRVLQEFLSANPAIGENLDNQLASLFIRVAPAGSGLEVYGEFQKEDRSENFRDLLLEPDHHSGYMVGFARAWGSADRKRVGVLRAEVVDSRITHIRQQRSQTPLYMHVAQSQGHTERGQILGSVGAYGGGASNVSYDRYTASGRTTVRWDRIIRGIPQNADGLPQLPQADVLHALSFERGLSTRRGEIAAGVALVKNFNRYFSSDATNASVSLSYRVFR